MSKISSYVCVRNALLCDYMVTQVVQSLIPVSDEVVISDGQSNDGTRDVLRQLERMDSRVRVIEYPWPNPVGDHKWWVSWLNWTRERLRFPMQLAMDGDEILDPGSYDEIRNAAAAGESRFFDRLNFWQDAQHLAPDGHLCGRFVARLGPSHWFMPSDEPYPDGEPDIKKHAKYEDTLRIFHYGFLRRKEAFFEKSKVVQRAFFNTYDERLKRAEEKGTHWLTECEGCFPQPLVTFTGQHPEIARQWLTERGYKV